MARWPLPQPPRERLIGHTQSGKSSTYHALTLSTVVELPRDQVERYYQYGMIDETDWMLYRFYWRNSQFRWSDVDCEFDIIPGQYD